MPTPQPGKQLHVLCHEHHIEMRMTEVEGSQSTETPAYACPPDCAVRYAASTGYFVASRHGQLERNMTLRVRCPRDGQPMYLAEINPEKTAFRLWRCPQCDASRTSKEGLVSDIP